MEKEKTFTYHYRGEVERWGKSGYVWKAGYSENGESGGVLYPWMTKFECRSEAQLRGGKAVFVEKD